MLNKIYNYEKIGARLEKERKAAGFKSQDCLADYIKDECNYHVTRQTISKWEKGKCMPPLDVMLALCNRYDCELGYLLCEYDTKTKLALDIGQETGLSEESVCHLKKLNDIAKLPGNDYSWARNAIRALNDLIERDIYFTNDVLLPIANYCIHRSNFEDPNASREEKNNSLKMFQLALFNATNGLTECIKDIYKKYSLKR